MRIIQNFLVTNKALVYFWAGSLLRMGLSLTKELMSPQKNFSILIFGSPLCTRLIPCHDYWNGWRPWLQQETETWRADSPAELPTWWRQRSQMKLIFRWNIVLHDWCQADEIVIEIKEWKQKVPGVCVPSFSRGL